MNVSQPTVKSI